MIKWEYKVSFFSDIEDSYWSLGLLLRKHLNKMGQDGWQLITVNNRIIYFKRMIEVEVSLEDGFKFAEDINPTLAEAVIEEIVEIVEKAVSNLAYRGGG